MKCESSNLVFPENLKDKKSTTSPFLDSFQRTIIIYFYSLAIVFMNLMRNVC